jgi:hypothetical protein
VTEGATANSTVVWTGRLQGEAQGGRDGWNTSPQDLSEALEGAHELVIVDALSFPWRSLPMSRREVPLTVTLPRELAAEEIVAVFGRPLLRHLTPYDRLRVDRSDVRSDLAELLELPPEVWSTDDPAPDDPPRHVQKARLYEAVAAVRTEVRGRQSKSEERPLLGFVGRASALAGLVSSSVVSSAYAVYSIEPGADPLATTGVELAKPTPHMVVVWLDDGGQSSEDRKALLSSSFDLLHPGGALIVLGYAVTEPGQSENPSISTLVRELSSACGEMVHVDEVRSIRWGGESLSRGVLIAATSLRVGRI